MGEDDELSPDDRALLVDIDAALVGFDGIGNGGKGVDIAFGKAGGEINSQLEDEAVCFDFDAA